MAGKMNAPKAGKNPEGYGKVSKSSKDTEKNGGMEGKKGKDAGNSRGPRYKSTKGGK